LFFAAFALLGPVACTSEVSKVTAPADPGAVDPGPDPSEPTDPTPAPSTPAKPPAKPQPTWTSLKMQASVGDITGAWGSSASDVWFVAHQLGGGSAIIHFDGTQITGQNTSGTLRTIWGSSRDKVWALGDDGAYVTFDGMSWTGESTFTNGDVYATWGSSVAWAVGQYVGVGNLRRTSTNLKDWNYGDQYDLPSTARSGRLRAVAGSGSKVFVGGEPGLWMWNGTSWTSLDDKDIVSLYGMGGGAVAASSLDVEFITNSGDVIITDAQPPNVSVSKSLLTAAWGTGSDDVWVVGTKGYLAHFDGTDWKQTPALTTHDLFAVWGSASDEVWAVGDDVILHYTTK